MPLSWDAKMKLPSQGVVCGETSLFSQGPILEFERTKFVASLTNPPPPVMWSSAR